MLLPAKHCVSIALLFDAWLTVHLEGSCTLKQVRTCALQARWLVPGDWGGGGVQRWDSFCMDILTSSCAPQVQLEISVPGTFQHDVP